MKEAVFSLAMIVWLAFLTISADCSMEIADNRIIFQTPSARFSFDGCTLTGLDNRDTNESYLSDDLTKRQPVAFLMKNRYKLRLDNANAKIERTGNEAANVIYHLEDGTSMVVQLELDHQTGDILISQYGKTQQGGVSGIEYTIRGIKDSRANIIFPSRWNAGTMFTHESDYGNKLYRFPTFWEAQIVIVDSPKGGFAVFSKDMEANFKSLNVYHRPGSFALSFQTQNNAPFDDLTEAKSVQWRISVYTGDWRVPARRFRDWMEKAYNLIKLEERKPEWVRRIKLCVQPETTEGISFLESLAKRIDPTCTLLYLPMWRKDNYDDNYPDYSAQEWVESYIQKAHNLGFHVILHTNYFGVDMEHPLYEKLKRWHCRDAYNGELLGWYNSFAYIDPAAPEWRTLFTKKAKEIMEKYHPDGIHLDQDHNAINDGIGTIDGLNGISGNMAFHEALTDAMPQIVLSGECINEITLKYNSFAQVAGIGGRVIDESRKGFVHPISAFLFSPYITFYGHLGIASPQLEADSWYAWKDWCERIGVIPTIKGVTGDELEHPEKPLADLLAEAQVYCQYQLTPSFETKLPSDVLLSLHGKDKAVARFESVRCDSQSTKGGIRRFVLQTRSKKPSIISCRVSRVARTSVGSIPGWMAYDYRGAIGLAKGKTYPYSDEKPGSSDFHISKLPENAVITSQRQTPNVFVFSIDNRNAIYADLVKLIGRATTGYQYFGGKRHRFTGPIDYTASGAVCRQEHAEKIWMHPPWRTPACDAEDEGIKGYGTGVTFAEYSLRLPQARRLALLGAIAMNPQREGQSDGSTFIIKVMNNGVTKTLMEQHYAEDAQKEFAIDMSNYASKEILLELQIAPGPDYSPDWDWAFFVRPRIVVEETAAEVMEVDSPVPIVALLDANGKVTLGNPTEIGDVFRYSLTSTLPNTFVFIFKAPDGAISVPHDLMSQERCDSFVGWNGVQRDIKEKRTLSVEEKRVSLKGVEKSAIVFQTKGGGIIYSDYLIALPEEPPVHLEVDVGLLRNASLMVPKGWGSSCTVEVNGAKIAVDWTQSAGWHHHTVDLSEYAGKTIILTLARYQKPLVMEGAWWAWGEPEIRE